MTLHVIDCLNGSTSEMQIIIMPGSGFTHTYKAYLKFICKYVRVNSLTDISLRVSELRVNLGRVTACKSRQSKIIICISLVGQSINMRATM